MYFKDVDHISLQEIQQLVTSKISEGPQLEFKLTPALQQSSEKKEFLGDVSAFANSSGGTIFYGIREDKGKAVAVEGFPCFDNDALILKVTSIIRDGLEPILSIRDFSIQILNLENNRVVMIIHVAQSPGRPHSIAYDHSGKYFGRGPAGKYQMKDSEIRIAMAETAALADNIRKMQQGRFDIALANPPVQLLPGPKIMLQLFPEESIRSKKQHLLDRDPRDARLLRPLGNVDHSYGHNAEGMIHTARQPGAYANSAYLQVFRNGVIETVNTITILPAILDADLIERYVIMAVRDYLAFYKNWGTETLVRCYLTIDGLGKQYLHSQHAILLALGAQIPPQRIIFGELVLHPYDFVFADLLPWFTVLWNAFGYSRSFNFSDGGEWKLADELKLHR
ncbi:MAG TPA: ATP-binding protein [Mucilaginibacter sp.]|jgi:hypothetical protein|nr:ATP-binding protein [Mucilaginibacter sp.]